METGLITVLVCVFICHPKDLDQGKPQKERGKACGWGEGWETAAVAWYTQKGENSKEKPAINRTEVSWHFVAKIESC